MGFAGGHLRFPLGLQKLHGTVFSMRAQALYEGRWVVLALLFLWAVLLGFQPWLALLPAGFLVFTFYFFRDPERRIPNEPGVIVAPADGLVTEIEEVADSPSGTAGWRLSIFLSVFDVHVNRAPVAGEIVSSVHKPGNFLDARHPDSHRKNESRTWTFLSQENNCPVVVRQITGAIARRIVAWSELGEYVARGERFGMIRFGSRTDLFLPKEVDFLVKPGDRVLGGETSVARWKQ